MNHQVVCIEVLVGAFPEWYEESEHDYVLEQKIEKHWHSNPSYQDAQVRVAYGYNGPHLVTAYNDDGDKVFERECDLDRFFDEIEAEVLLTTEED